MLAEPGKRARFLFRFFRAVTRIIPHMKKNIHPRYEATTIHCTCGAEYKTRSTVKNLRIGICAACHPFFTGEQRFVDTAGRVEKFARRFGATTTRRTKPKLGVKA